MHDGGSGFLQQIIQSVSKADDGGSYDLMGGTPPTDPLPPAPSAAATPRMLYGSPEGTNVDVIQMLTATKAPPPPAAATTSHTSVIAAVNLSAVPSLFGSPSGAAAAATTSPSAPDHVPARPVRVAVRVRPFTSLEMDAGARRVVTRAGNQLIIVNPEAFDADPDAVATAAAAAQCKEWAQAFRFDDVLWSHDVDPDAHTAYNRDDTYVSQEGVHRTLGCGIVDHVLAGTSSTLFAYGPTGTGKTHTLFGRLVSPSFSKVGNRAGHHAYSKKRALADYEVEVRSMGDINEESGLVPRLLRDVIDGVHQRHGSGGFGDDVRVTLSFLEIHNDKIRDLLAPTDTDAPALRVREHPTVGPYVEGATKYDVGGDVGKALRLLGTGLSRCTMAMASGGWNAHPSRAHALVTLELSVGLGHQASPASAALRGNLGSPTMSFLHSKAPNGDADLARRRAGEVDGGRRYVKLHCVDLAGSEAEPYPPTAVKRTEDELEMLVTSSLGQQAAPAAATAAECKAIRRSLSTLGYILRELGRGEPLKSLPYRDSTLTWLLRDALNGRNHATVVATVSPAHTVHDETMHTLRYAERLFQQQVRGQKPLVCVACGPLTSYGTTAEHPGGGVT